MTAAAATTITIISCSCGLPGESDCLSQWWARPGLSPGRRLINDLGAPKDSHRKEKRKGKNHLSQVQQADCGWHTALSWCFGGVWWRVGFHSVFDIFFKLMQCFWWCMASCIVFGDAHASSFHTVLLAINRKYKNLYYFKMCILKDKLLYNNIFNYYYFFLFLHMRAKGKMFSH